MPTLQDLMFLLPIGVTSFLGALSQDFMLFLISKEQGDSLFVRSGRVVVSAILSTMLVGFGTSILFPNLDWKILALSGFIMGFMGFRIATLFATSSFGLRILGRGDLADAIDLQEKDLKEKKK